MLVALNTSIIGVLAVADQAKREAASTVAALHKLGLQVHAPLMYYTLCRQHCLCD
jgi:cation transport ATPase